MNISSLNYIIKIYSWNIFERKIKIYDEKEDSYQKKYDKPSEGFLNKVDQIGNSCFEKAGNNYRQVREREAEHRNIRFDSVVSLLNDLDLVNLSDNTLECTVEGEKTIKRNTDT